MSIERFSEIVNKNYTYDTLAKFRIHRDIIKPFYSNEEGKVVAILTDVDRIRILDENYKVIVHDPEDITKMCKTDVMLKKTDEYINQLKEEDKSLGYKAKRSMYEPLQMKKHIGMEKNVYVKKIRFIED